MHETYNEIYMKIYKRLSKAFPDSAPDMAREIVCHVFKKPRAEFHKIRQLYTLERKDEEIENYIEQCLTGKPLAYLFGEWDFYGLNLTITPDVLIPRADTEILAETAIARLKSMTAAPLVLDLCTGSGCLGLAIAQHVPHAAVTMLDVSGDALDIARKNTEKYRLTDRVGLKKGDVFKDPEESLRDFSMIVCNPPYIRTEDMKTIDESVRNFEPALALDGGADGLRFFEAVVSRWTQALRNGGILMFECGFDQATDVMNTLKTAGYTDVSSVRDLNGIERVVTGRRPTRLRTFEPK